MGKDEKLGNPVVLVTAATVSELAQKLLREGGADIEFMPGAVDEDALVKRLNLLPWRSPCRLSLL